AVSRARRTHFRRWLSRSWSSCGIARAGGAGPRFNNEKFAPMMTPLTQHSLKNRVVEMRTMWPVVMAAFLILSGTRIGADERPVSAVITSAAARAAYLAHATIWKDPGDLTPDDLRVGPSGVFPYAAADALDGVDCTFVKPGKELRGKSAKFLCDAG